MHWRLYGEHRPADMFYEIDDDEVENRKVERYICGKMDIAGPDIETGEKWISGDYFPALEQINKDTQFEAKEISEAEFNEVWDLAILNLRRSGSV